MSGYEFDPKDKDGSLRDRFDCYCKEVIGRAAHNLVFKQAQYLILHFGGGEIDPSMMMHEDEHYNLYAIKMTVRGKDVFIGDERLAKMLPKLQKRKREILLIRCTSIIGQYGGDSDTERQGQGNIPGKRCNLN